MADSGRDAWDDLTEAEQEIVYDFFDGMSKHDAIMTALLWMSKEELQGILAAYREASEECDDA